MLAGVKKTSTLSSWEIKIRNPYEQYVDWGKNINFYLHSHLKSDAVQGQGCSEHVLTHPSNNVNTNIDIDSILIKPILNHLNESSQV